MATDFDIKNRVIGALVGTATGDALGASYEFQPSVKPPTPIVMRGNSVWSAGEWTDDTDMALGIAAALLAEYDISEAAGQEFILAQWLEWSETSKDVGIQTRHVLNSIRSNPTRENSRAISEALHVSTHRTAGNGSLMRTSPVGIHYFRDPAQAFRVAYEISQLTHWDPAAAEACGLWSYAIAHAISVGDLTGLSQALDMLEPDRREFWQERIHEAETRESWEFENNGWVVAAFQAAWSAIARTNHTNVPAGVHVRNALVQAVRSGNDADTVAAIAGSLIGAAYGASALPCEWVVQLHDSRGKDHFTLADTALAIAGYGLPTPGTAVNLSHFSQANVRKVFTAEPLITLGGQGVLQTAKNDFDCVVSLSFIKPGERLARADHHSTVWVLDSDEEQANPHLALQFMHVAQLLERWIKEDKRILLHCVQAHTRTPSFAAAYLIWRDGIPAIEAMNIVKQDLPHANFHFPFADTLTELEQVRNQWRSV
jgi:ADP-ribosyl-[dinitrogen reductase] hydrolase